MMRRDKNFLIIFSGLVLRLDIKKSELTSEPAAVEMLHGHGMRVVPARPRGLGSERILAVAMRGNEWSSFFLGTVNF